jgi:hypothetical protein
MAIAEVSPGSDRANPLTRKEIESDFWLLLTLRGAFFEARSAL